MPFTAHRVATRLWVGSAPTTPAERRVVCDNVGAIVFCAEEFQPESRLFPGVEVVRCGIDDADLTRQEKERVLRTARVVDDACADGQRVLVTCWQGRNRSALVAAAAMIIRGYTPRQAIATVRERRKVSYVLSNPSFVRFLHDFWDFHDDNLWPRPRPWRR